MNFQSEYHGCRSRVCLEGWTGRRRRYYCRVCQEPFTHDGFQLPEKSRICPVCLREPKNLKTYEEGFIEQRAKEESEGMIP
jgi:hypothetical protein